MLQDIPYSTLREDKIGFEVLTLRTQDSASFSDIAKKFGISAGRARQLSYKMQLKQTRLYIQHIAFVLGHEDTAQIREEASAVYDCYMEFSYTIAYLEKKYKDILDEYREGAPGMPEAFVKSLPPWKRSLSKKTISRIVEMRETEKATFPMIAKKLHITPEKAKHTYDSFYLQQVAAYVESLQKEAKSYKEKWFLWCRFFGSPMTAKKRYEMMLKEKEQ